MTKQQIVIGKGLPGQYPVSLADGAKASPGVSQKLLCSVVKTRGPQTNLFLEAPVFPMVEPASYA